jgi:tetratricopeptide (TPR) repeat protein
MNHRVPDSRLAALPLLVAALLVPALSRLQAQAGPAGPRADSTRQAQRLDTDGNHTAARAIFQRLIETAPDPAAKAAAQRRMAISYGFEGNCARAVEYEEQVIGYWVTREAAEPQNAFYQEGEMANEAARLCIDAGDFATAERMYRKGSELGLREPEPKTHPGSLWDFRLAHAMARLAARRGNAAEARRQVDRARMILAADTAMAAQQSRFLPYLAGYVALYTDDLKTAEAELTRATELNQNDPFMQTLLAMTYEKLGQREKATAIYRKAYDMATGHNPPSAFARPYAGRKLGAP